MTRENKIAVIAGVGPGLGESCCSTLVDAGYRVCGLSRRGGPQGLVERLGADHYLPVRCDVTDSEQVGDALDEVERRFGPASVYIHNAAKLHFGPFIETPPAVFDELWRGMLLGAVHGTQRVLPGMLERGCGTILIIGATASVKAGARFAAFGAAKFALRGLAQSLARELGPQGIHVVHLIIDGVIWGERAAEEFKMTHDQCLEPAAIAKTALQLIEQDRSAWTHEIDLRPDRETF